MSHTIIYIPTIYTAPGPSLTTEYTPRERGTPVTKLDIPLVKEGSLPLVVTPTKIEAVRSSSSVQETNLAIINTEDDGPDPSTLPPARAPPSHPTIDPSQPGVVDGHSILDFDLSSLADKGWRRPGADISDWFNYGFDEISWEAYCYRRRELGETAALLKAGVMVCSIIIIADNPQLTIFTVT
jgi:pre-mRNA 3'-end-processing factor FIP1